MKDYLKGFGYIIFAVILFVCLEHVIIFRTYSSLEETCRVILKDKQ